MVNEKDEILEFLQTHKKELKLLGIERIGIFGSYAKKTTIHQIVIWMYW